MKTCVVFSRSLKVAKNNFRPVIDSEVDDAEVLTVPFVSGDGSGGTASITLTRHESRLDIAKTPRRGGQYILVQDPSSLVAFSVPWVQEPRRRLSYTHKHYITWLMLGLFNQRTRSAVLQFIINICPRKNPEKALIADSIGQRPGRDAKILIGKAMLRETFEAADLHSFERYFRYYEQELGLLNFGKIAKALRPTPLAVATHADVIKVVNAIRTRQDSTKLELRLHLAQHFDRANNDEIDRSIDLGVRLWAMVNVREPRLKLLAPQTEPISWQRSATLRSLLAQTFPRSRWQLEVKDSRLHPSFTAAFMTDICGLQLEWTDCLADHLRLDRRQKALRIYSYKSVLQYHLKEALSSNTKRPVAGLPAEVYIETIYSLNLLFPQWDAATNKLLREQGQTFQLTGPYGCPRTLNLMEFDYLRDRLLELYDVVFQSPPVSWAQLWRDRRNPQQFWTFWIALIILALTLVSTVASIIQACAAF